MTPLRVRKIAAASGLAKMVRNVCSSASSVRPTGIVATTISQASRSSAVTTLRVFSVRKNAPMIRTQSVRKNHNSANAVATCRATMKARYGDCSLLPVADVGDLPDVLGQQGRSFSVFPGARNRRVMHRASCPASVATRTLV